MHYKTLRGGQFAAYGLPTFPRGCTAQLRFRNTCLQATYDVDAEYSKSDLPSRIKSRSRLRHGRLFTTVRRHTYVIGRIRKYLSFARAHTAEWISRARNLGSRWCRYWILNVRYARVGRVFPGKIPMSHRQHPEARRQAGRKSRFSDTNFTSFFYLSAFSVELLRNILKVFCKICYSE